MAGCGEIAESGAERAFEGVVQAGEPVILVTVCPCLAACDWRRGTCCVTM